MERTSGIRPNRCSHRSTTVRPIRLAPARPVRNTTSKTSSTRKPGRLNPNSDCGDRNAGTTLSSVLINKAITQIVMTRGIQINRPVMK